MKDCGGNKIKILMLGNGLPAINILKFLLRYKKKEIEILAIAPFGKKVRSWHESFYDCCKKFSVTVLNPRDVNDEKIFRRLKKFSPDYVFSVYYDQIINEQIIGLPKYCAINFHPSLLPKYRGVAPVIWALINGEKETGVTGHFMVKGVDKGEILIQRKMLIKDSDTGYSLHNRVARLVYSCFKELFLRLMDNDCPKPRKQKGKTSYYPRALSGSKNEINWENSALSIHNIVRALTLPLPGAHGYLEGKKINIWKTEIYSRKVANLRPGELSLERGQLIVKTGKGALAIKKISVEGMDVGIKDFWKIVKNKPSFEKTICER